MKNYKYTIYYTRPANLHRSAPQCANRRMADKSFTTAAAALAFIAELEADPFRNLDDIYGFRTGRRLTLDALTAAAVAEADAQ